MDDIFLNPLTVQTDVATTLEHAWHAWTTPESIQQWNHASNDWHCPMAVNDVKIGGAFSYTMAALDGSFSFDFGGTYTEIIESKAMCYTMGDGRKARVTFEQLEDCVRVVEVFEPETENTPELQRSGWQAILDNFKQYTENSIKPANSH
jgi:uncharacterized protein YndB with AHSA1/START domain